MATGDVVDGVTCGVNAAGEVGNGSDDCGGVGAGGDGGSDDDNGGGGGDNGIAVG